MFQGVRPSSPPGFFLEFDMSNIKNELFYDPDDIDDQIKLMKSAFNHFPAMLPPKPERRRTYRVSFSDMGSSEVDESSLEYEYRTKGYL